MFGQFDEQSSPKPILVVDDNDELRFLMSRALEGAGYTVFEARDGTEAVELLAERIQIQLLITDLQMPGLSGLELVKRFRADSSAPVLFITGYALDASELPGPMLEKPFTPALLVETVKRLLATTLMET
jgi:CheY-like chemotaxis protein